MRSSDPRPSRAAARGVLFDMDGVLVATEELKARAHFETVRRHGGELTPEYYGEVMGRSHEAAAIAFIDASGADLEPSVYAEVFRSVYGDLLTDGVDLLPGAIELVSALKGRGYRVAIVSSSLRWMMDEVLSQTGLGRLFDASVSADDVSAEKPSPDPYLKALSELGLEPDQAVVVEDSESGVASANAAGIAVIALRHQYNGRHDMSGAIAEIHGLSDLTGVVRLVESALG
jgi:HAD superfamily hydrolase (TIGR01509 family)